MTVHANDAEPLWTPTAQEVASARLTLFMNALREQGVIPPDIRDMHALQQWSVAHIEEFWAEVWLAADVIATRRSDGQHWHTILQNGDVMQPPHGEFGPRWFAGASLNFAENMLRRRDDHTAIVAWTEDGRQSAVSYRALAEQVAHIQSALQRAGVGVGDRVVGYLPNIPEAVVAMLATAALGAVWSSCSPDFGTKGVLDRFGQIEPKVLIAANGYRYAGKLIDCRDRIAEVAAALPSLAELWVVPNVPELGVIPGASNWTEVIGAHHAQTDIEFRRMPFDHPLYILYSSGTTGLPKCLVHGAGGTLLQHWKEHALHTDIGSEDVVFYFTTCGWMMWNWLVSTLMQGATLMLYDGAPFAPDPHVLLRMAEQEGVSVFGISAKYLAVLEKESPDALREFDLRKIRTILSTGSPLATNSYDFVYAGLTHGVRLASISGGTDIVSCFALGDPTGAVWRGELQTRGLGMAVEVFSEQGLPLRDEAGELVCTRPFPSMPVAFWNDPDGSRYRSAYFEYFPGVWRHGDWAEMTAHDGLVIHGRSDATLNPGGVRIGTAEIYRQVEQVPEILESIAVEQTTGSGGGTNSRLVLFVRLREGVSLSDDLRATIRQRLREHASPHHVPKVILAVPDIPRTISGKITELAVREIIHGRPVHNVDALANPGALEHFKSRPELTEWQA
ncbi:MAG: acetoacetate--CoA ligase [Phycisphaerae bacterium]|nr:acetoacetate--CoA ligase [Gemmatimonadaceae bacterium]